MTPAASTQGGAVAEEQTCASCQNIGVFYWDDGFTKSHHCMKEAARRAEGMPAGSDLFAHFRAFFDARAEQKACRHYQERPTAAPDVLALLGRMAATGRAEVKFLSDESRLAHSLEGKFVQQDYHAKSPKGYRVFRLLDVGRSEISRAARQEGGT